jgi:predicted O-methyltransferase YrrM
MKLRIRDGTASAYTGLSAALADYRERRYLRGESPTFRRAAERASFISGMMSRRETECLFELAGAVPAGRDIVEIGSYLGRSTAYLGLGLAFECHVHAVDPFENGFLQLKHGQRYDTFDQFRRNMHMVGLDETVVPHAGDSTKVAHHYDGKPIGLLFIDGDHSEDGVVADAVAWKPHLASGCLVAFDDIEWTGVSAGLRRLVQEGVVSPLAGRVGKVGLCGPAAAWPDRVKQLAQPCKLEHDPSHLSIKSHVRNRFLKNGLQE